MRATGGQAVTHGLVALQPSPLPDVAGRLYLASADDDLRATAVAPEITRTFWEKATILHTEHRRPPDLPIRDRFARPRQILNRWRYVWGHLSDAAEKIST